MPLKVDHEVRRSTLADAVWRIVLRDGVAGASVREVAREAGLSMGSVRHFFRSQEELLLFAMQEVVRRGVARIQAGADRRERLVERGDPLAAAADLLEQVVPLDAERLIEARIWAGFGAIAAVDSAMAAIRREADLQIRGLCRSAMVALAELGRVHPGRDLTVETERVWAVLDGITMHRIWDPPYTSVRTARAVLREHLASLALPPVVTGE